jgi:hypothetical protein
VAGHRTGEDSDDLRHWLESLPDAPPVALTVLASCSNTVHGDEPPTWFFVEGDAASSIARRRCLACGGVTHLLDSEAHWTPSPMKTCETCAQAMFEIAAGLNVVGGAVQWVVVGLRCVGCGSLQGLTDFVVEGRPVDEVVAEL